ncbi:MAG: glycosyltransferase family 2 protein [Deltaproteobacteria bacterium]|nr:glycosyltransferase family 2 protein [Deltaproteobacteria bacterium]
MTPDQLSIVVPICNEVDSVDEFFRRVDALGLADCLIFVDNASTDGTLDRLAALPRGRLIRHATNEGWGASVRDGIAASDSRLIVLMDGDLEYPPEVLPALLEALRRHPVVYGSRFRGAAPPDMPLARRLGNALMSRFYNLLYGQRTSDFATGLKGLQRAAAPWQRLRLNGWEHGAEIAVLLAFAGNQIAEIAVDYAPRQRGRSKMRHVREALKVIGYLLWFRLRGARAMLEERAKRNHG